MWKLFVLISVAVKLWFTLLREASQYFFGLLGKKKTAHNPFLEENFAPVFDELWASDLPVNGKLPEDLDGVFVRNGPNPRFDHHPSQGGHYHWFDGDGMLHAVIFEDGRATYTNRWVKTQRWKDENESGKRLYPRLGDLRNASAFFLLLADRLLRTLHIKKRLTGKGTANTNVEYHDGRLLALVENDVPHHVKLPRLETVGPYDYNGKLQHTFTAHPKVDAKTGEMVFFGYRVESAPYVFYSVVSKEGCLVRTLPIDIEVPVMMHDFAITQHYSIIMELPFTFRPERLLEGKSPLAFEPMRRSRFGTLPRHAKKQADIRWFETPSCFIFHTFNAWEEGKHEVVLLACRSKSTGSLNLDDNGYGFSEAHLPFAHEWRFNLASNSVKERRLWHMPCEFPRVRDDLLGYPTRYGYAMRVEDHKDSGNVAPKLDAILKFDFKSGEEESGSSSVKKEKNVKVMKFPRGKYGGECVFVPRKQAENEDDGYLITFVYDELRDTTELWVMDAASFTEECEPVATIPIPRRVPYGFHGKWISREALFAQQQ
ncbi:Dioxygenase [Balamuthia mandrillaris]